MSKKYRVPVRTHVSADYLIIAESKESAHRIVEKEMEESLKRQLAEAVPHPFIENISGYTEAMKTGIEIVKE